MTEPSNDSSKHNISFTAHYTAYVWYHFGLSIPQLKTKLGQWLYIVLAPFEFFGRVFLRQQVKDFLLQRHLLIDQIIKQQGADQQVLEIACGLSPRGNRFRQQHGFTHYIEADLPAMAKLKKQLLASANDEGKVISIDILKEDGPDSLLQMADLFDTSKPLTIVMEGLIYYFDEATVTGIFQRIHKLADAFPQLTIVGDIYPKPQQWYFPILNAARSSTAWITKSRFHFLFETAENFAEEVEKIGFSKADIISPSSYQQHDIPTIENYPLANNALVRIFLIKTKTI